MISHQTTLRTVYTLFAVLAGWTGLALQANLTLSPHSAAGMTTLEGIWRLLGYYTILTNLLAATSLTIALFASRSRLAVFLSRPSVQTPIAVYMFFVFFIYNSFLKREMNLQGLQFVADVMLHYTAPFLYLLYWALFVPKGTLTFKEVFPWLIYPIGYAIYVLLRALGDGFYPYPFVNVLILGYPRVLLNICLLSIGFLIVSLVFVGADRGFKRRSPLAS